MWWTALPWRRRLAKTSLRGTSRLKSAKNGPGSRKSVDLQSTNHQKMQVFFLEKKLKLLGNKGMCKNIFDIFAKVSIKTLKLFCFKNIYIYACSNSWGGGWRMQLFLRLSLSFSIDGTLKNHRSAIANSSSV